MVIDKVRHDGDRDSAGTLREDLANLLVFESNYILSIHFGEVMFN